jgi:hypothetical protein
MTNPRAQAHQRQHAKRMLLFSHGENPNGWVPGQKETCSGKGLCMAESGLARPTAATRAAFGIPSSIVGSMVARA